MSAETHPKLVSPTHTALMFTLLRNGDYHRYTVCFYVLSLCICTYDCCIYHGILFMLYANWLGVQTLIIAEFPFKNFVLNL